MIKYYFPSFFEEKRDNNNNTANPNKAALRLAALKIQMSLEGNDRRLQQLEIEVEIQEMANRLLRQIQEYISNQDHNINSEEMNTAQFNFQTLIDSTNQHITTIRNEVRDFLDTFEDQIRESDTES